VASNGFGADHPQTVPAPTAPADPLPTTPLILWKARRRGAKDRARYACLVRAGLILIRPTLANGAVIFGVSTTYARAAKNGNGKIATPAAPLARAWARATPEARDAFIAAHAETLLSALDRATAAP
jgi:hypothetical protein